MGWEIGLGEEDEGCCDCLIFPLNSERRLWLETGPSAYRSSTFALPDVFHLLSMVLDGLTLLSVYLSNEGLA